MIESDGVVCGVTVAPSGRDRPGAPQQALTEHRHYLDGLGRVRSRVCVSQLDRVGGSVASPRADDCRVGMSWRWPCAAERRGTEVVAADWATNLRTFTSYRCAFVDRSDSGVLRE